jgi:hypothetical protein
MRKKIINIFMIFVISIFIGSFIYAIYNNTELKNKVSLLESDINKLKNNQSNGECTFVKTLRIVSILDYQSAILEDKFILVDSFQSFNPFVLRLNINDDIKEGLYYEFTFKGNKDMYTNNDASLSNFKILTIKETNKEEVITNTRRM